MALQQLTFALLVACLCRGTLVSCGALCEPSPGWHLVWSDEFSGDALNTSQWTAQDKASPRNHELEDYDPANVLVRDGKLVLVTRRQNRAGMNYTSGLVDSHDKVSFRYGRICVRAKLPPGKDGIWPAHWMEPSEKSCWPDKGEIDIMEMINGDGELHGTLHWNPDYPPKNCTGRKKQCSHTKRPISLDEYHEFAVEWSSSSMTFYVDGEPYGQCLPSGGSNIPQVAHFFILNTAVGGNWPKQPDNTTTLPQEHLIDYVRVYQQSSKGDLWQSITSQQPPNYYDELLHRPTGTCSGKENDLVLDPEGFFRNITAYKAIQLNNIDSVEACNQQCCSEPKCITYSFSSHYLFENSPCEKGSVCCILGNYLPDLIPNPHGVEMKTGTVLKLKQLPGPTPPFPPSTFIKSASFGTEIYTGPRGDTWTFAWADDDQLYGLAGDNRRSSINVWKVTGSPGQSLDVNLINKTPLNLLKLCPESTFTKPSSLLAIKNVLYMGVSCMVYGDYLGFNRQHNKLGFMAVSTDFGETWTVEDNATSFFDSQLAAPEFIQFGKGNNLASYEDHQVYALFPSSIDGKSYWDNNDIMLLGRTQSADTILQRESWEFFSGFESHSSDPMWNKVQAEAVPVMTYHNMLGENDVSYNPYIKRFIMANYGFIDGVTGLPMPWHNCNPSPDCVKRTQLTLYEAEQLWGPWSVFYREDDWDSTFPVGHRGHYTPTFPSKWMKESSMWMVYSASSSSNIFLAKEMNMMPHRK